MSISCIRFVSFVFSLLAACCLSAQTVIVKDTVMTTYSFSDPNPVPNITSYYPYHKFDKFGTEPKDKSWKVIELENDYLKVIVFPEIGGKVWSVYDKSKGKDVFYDNKVVKFREIAMRGPWTSGGIEFNYGIIGHAPSCSHPVEWATALNEDGSVSCFVGAWDFLTRTRWTVEINLPKDAAWLRTRTFWHNSSGLYKPYYTWANSAVKATEDLEIIYPAAYSISHYGTSEEFPVNSSNVDISFFKNQKYGADKSLHPGGSHKGFFGAYYHDDDFGMLHYALRDEKIGRKYFSWAQSAQGSIWIDLLTDQKQQYVEMQSGRLFNQNFDESNYTPFKQTLFAPYGTDEWDEYWMPVAEIGGADYVTLTAAVKKSDDTFGIYPYRHSTGRLAIYDKERKEIFAKEVDFSISVPEFISVSDIKGIPYIMKLNGIMIWTADEEATERPDRIINEYDKKSPEGLTDAAYSYYGMKKLNIAEELADKALKEVPTLRKALILKAMICNDRGLYQDSYDNTMKVLSIDTYDPYANYINGVAAEKLDREYEAMDRFEVAAMTSECRSASLTRLAAIYFRRGDMETAHNYAKKALINNSYNIAAMQIQYLSNPQECILKRINSLDYLNHFDEFESYLDGKISGESLADAVKEELRYQVYLEYAMFYHDLGLDEKAYKIIDACPQQNALMHVWKAYLKKAPSDLSVLDTASVDFVFPFRPESVKALEWAISAGSLWKAEYMLSQLMKYLGDSKSALALIEDTECDHAPFYAYRYSLNNKIEDLAKASELDPDQWRYKRDLTNRLRLDGRYTEALAVIGPYFKKNPENFHLGDAYIQLMMAMGNYKKAESEISRIRILPFEGQKAGHSLWRKIKLHLAAECIDQKKYRSALTYIDQALQWPENLGSGKPYDELIDSDIENQLRAVIYERINKKEMVSSCLADVKGKRDIYDSSQSSAKLTPLVDKYLGL